MFGLAGIQAYANDCADTDKYEDWAACHDINGQWAVRNSTAVYLERVAKAGIFTKQSNGHLLAAAKKYRQAYECWQQLYMQLGHDAPEDAGKTKERRLAGATAVRKALDYEKTAIAAITKVLQIERVDTPAVAAVAEGARRKPMGRSRAGQ